MSVGWWLAALDDFRNWLIQEAASIGWAAPLFRSLAPRRPTLGPGQSPFEQWFRRLDDVVAARVTTSLTRLGAGNWSNVNGVGAGVFEVKIDFGPGYCVCFGKAGETIVILLGGGTKKRQSRDIEAAQDHWKQYKKRRT